MFAGQLSWAPGPAPATWLDPVTLTCGETGVVLGFWGRLDDRPGLAASLDLDPCRARTLSDAELVLAAWRHWGDAVPARLTGDFSLAVVDAAARRVFLARDAVGVKPLYYRRDGRALAFATSVAALRSRCGGEATPDTRWMAGYLLQMPMSAQQTGYEQIRKLPPGHSLSVDGSGRERLTRWFGWRDDPPEATRREQRWVDAYRERLEEAMRCRLPERSPLGSENSGGIDSAAVTAFAARALDGPGDRLHSFGFALGAQEEEYILATSRHAGICHDHLLRERRGDDDESIERGLAVLGYPCEHGDAADHLPIYRQCAELGIGTLLSGFGGDEAVSGNAQHLRLELVDGGHYGALWDILPGRPRMKALRFARAIGRRHLRPKFNPRFLAAFTARWPHQWLRADVVARLGLHEAWLESARYDAPFRRVNEWAIDRLAAGFVPTRLENCTLLAASYGVDYRWPLLDVRLVQQYLSTPGIEKVGPGGIGRYLHRRAIAGVVPDKVAWKSSKDMGYTRVLERMFGEDLLRVADVLERELAQLAPALAEMIEGGRVREQLRRVRAGPVDAALAFTFRRSARSLRWLNRWLTRPGA